MGFRSGLWSKLGLDAFKAEQAQLLAKWEYDQTNDWDLLDADPFKDALLAATGEVRAQLTRLAERYRELPDF